MKLKTVYFIAALIFLSGIIGSVILLQKPKTEIVEIIQDEKILYTIDLSKCEDKTIKLEYGGSYNIIEIKDGKIHIKEAGCKDKVCVNHGRLNSTAPIVCLPNHLVIRYSAAKDVDAVVG